MRGAGRRVQGGAPRAAPLRVAVGIARCREPTPPLPAADEQLVSLWLTSMGVLAQTLATDGCQPLRDSAIMVLG